ncbi:MAG: sodium-dependent bicarbonate transport family permease [Actinobacteria bacterium]|nr:sodium-dependent bicarbonate transport family permease [Actinomycetota bacterium]MDA2982382.1 sodium-dependent bicarbonate transport family permease [Actinomycetota bacterium]MDA2997100.1 sodium-dependent bicarbonate transport family permease [Actinomycetota bacterium]
MDSTSVAITNLTSVAVLVFILGFLGARIKSDVRIPEQVYQMISIFLLFGIGLKGGHALKGTSFSSIAAPAIATIALGILIPIIAYLTLKFVKKINDIDRGAIAAHYGSTSLVTFSAALLFLESSGIEIEGFATALLTIMEVPGIVVGVYLGSRHRDKSVQWGKTLHEVVTGKTILLLVGGLVIGAVTSEAGYLKVTPFFIDLQSGFLVLFLLHLGYLAGSNWGEIKKVGAIVGVFALIFPIFAGTLGVLAGTMVGLSIGGATILGVLSASASYIAAPAAVSIGLPEANAPLALMSSIGVTFPFNLLIGIPLYLEIAKAFSGL